MATIHSRKRGGRKVWLAQVRLKGFDPVSRQFDDKAAAAAWAEEEERSLRKLRDRGPVVPEIASITLADLIDRYLRDPNTAALDSYADTERLLGYWRGRYGTTRLRAFGPAHVIDGRDALLAKGRKPATVNRYVSWLRRAWNWGRGTAGLVDSAAAWPPGLLLTENNTRSRFLSDDELAVLLASARKLYPIMHAAILVSLATGIRQGELLRLEWRDVRKDSLTIRETKTDTPRSVYLPGVAAARLRELKEAPIVGTAVIADDVGQRFTLGDLLYRWRRIRDDAGLENFRWHDLRHSCASFLAQNGASLLEIGQVLGHKSPATTARYAHLVAGKAVTGHSKLDAKLKGAT
ncbi:MAG: site-specific integrase [Steroidobacteraceae bacterium]